MKAVKIIHCADMHFDTPFAGLPNIQAEGRKEDLKESFSKIIDLAKEEDISILLIAGDLFDHERIRRSTLEYLIKKFEEIPQTYVFISPGNHDPYHIRSFYHIIEWPENVHIFKGEVDKVYIPNQDIYVYGAAFLQPHQRTSLIEGFHVEDESKINIMVLHGDIVSIGQGSDYNPITKEYIEKSGLDYLALGHQHSHTGVYKEGNTFWSYSGNPEGRGFDELDSRGILIGKIGKGWCNLEFKEICKRKYFEKKIDISSMRTYEEIITMIKNQLNDHSLNENLYKILLTGEIKEDFYIYPELLEDKISEQFYFVKIKDNTSIKVDYEELSGIFSLKGLFAKEMLNKIEREQEEGVKEILEQALKAGIQALENGEVYI